VTPNNPLQLTKQASSNFHAQICRLSGARLMLAVSRHRVRVALLMVALLGLVACSTRSTMSTIEAFRNGAKVPSDGIVEIYGFANIRGENTNLYADKVAAEAYDSSNCVGLLMSEERFEEYSDKFDNRWVRIIGEYLPAVCPVDSICTWICSADAIDVHQIYKQ
jgi:hypothetical protein